jgi:hypothetical protein
MVKSPVSLPAEKDVPLKVMCGNFSVEKKSSVARCPSRCASPVEIDPDSAVN